MNELAGTLSSEIVYRGRLSKFSKPNLGSLEAFIKTSSDKMPHNDKTFLLSCKLESEVCSLYCMKRASQSAEESKDGNDEEDNGEIENRVIFPLWTGTRMWRRYFSKVVIPKVIKH